MLHTASLLHDGSDLHPLLQPLLLWQGLEMKRLQCTVDQDQVNSSVLPPPPPFRPTTFWRKTRRSGVTSASYSPSSYLIRRSTYIAAGLKFDKPIHDFSALCVESRIGVVCKATNEEWF